MLEESSSTFSSGGSKRRSSKIKVQSLSKIDLSSLDRVSSGFVEFDRVLGASGRESGFVQGQVILVSGDPGIGKSTLLLEVLGNLSRQDERVIYVSAEESAGQVALRAKRIGFKGSRLLDNFKIVSSSDVDGILDVLEKEKAKFVVVDSIQTVTSSETRGIPGGIAQVRACANKFVNYARSTDTTLLIVGHINKDGHIAGPKTLEHLVDSVFQMEGDEKYGFRLIRSIKNRFGATNEVGILGMDSDGMKDIKDASAFFVSNDSSAGVARSAIIEGNRVLIVEIQALTNPTIYSLPKRVAQGISVSKLQLICAILQKHAKLRLSDKDVYVNVAGGLMLKDPAVDLAVAAAIVSSLKLKPINSKAAILGELSLSGKIGSVTRLKDRVKELKRLGYKDVLTSEISSDIRAFVGKMFK